MSHQDWEPVIFKKAPPKTNSEALRRGLPAKKTTQIHNLGGINHKKLETDETYQIPTVGKEIGNKIIQSRIALKMSQKTLASKVNEKVDVISKFETGKAVKNQNIINKLSKVLRTNLNSK